MQMALNEYADLTGAEFAAVKLGTQPGSGRVRDARSSGFMHEHVSAPESVDWRKKGGEQPSRGRSQLSHTAPFQCHQTAAPFRCFCSC